MLATPWPEWFADEAWQWELKWDGIRAIVTIDDGISIRSRRGNDVTARYPEIGAGHVERPVVLDGEIVAFDGERPSFERLQSRMNLSSPGLIEASMARTPVTYVVFDLLYDGGEIVDLPWDERRARLEGMALPDRMVVADVFADPEPLWSFVLARGIEGIVGKRVDSPYRPGVRSPDWRKVAAFATVRAVVTGFTPGEGGRSGTFGSLLLALWDGDRLRPIGTVGSGFDDRSLRAIRGALDEMVVAELPIEGEIPRDAVLVRPALVAAVQYREWTSAGRLRAPSFKGFTDDPSEAITWEAEGPPGR